MVEPQFSKLETPDQYRSPALQGIESGRGPAAPVTSPTRSATAVAVPTYDFAFLKLDKNTHPASVTKAARDVELLILKMIELQNYGI